MPKCAWTHCPCNQVIEDMSDAVKDKTRYYHKDCLKQRNTINDIITLFTEQVNDKIVMSQLRNIINTLIFTEGFEAEYVLYAVRYAINHPYMKLTYPAGIRRICLDQNVLDIWEKTQNQKFMEQITSTTFIADDVRGEPSGNVVRKEKKWGSVICQN